MCFEGGWIHHGQIPNNESRNKNSTNKGGMFGDINRTQYFVENMCFATETAPFYQNAKEHTSGENSRIQIKLINWWTIANPAQHHQASQIGIKKTETHLPAQTRSVLKPCRTISKSLNPTTSKLNADKLKLRETNLKNNIMQPAQHLFTTGHQSPPKRTCWEPNSPRHPPEHYISTKNHHEQASSIRRSNTGIKESDS